MSKKEREPVQDAVKAYLELAYGLTEASKKKAEKTVKKLTSELLGKGTTTAGQLQTMAEDVVALGLSNREALGRLVRVELDRALDRALGRVGLATSEEVAILTARIRELEHELAEVKGAGVVAAKPAARAADVEPVTTAEKAPARRVPAKKSVAKKAPAKKSPAKMSSAEETASERTVAKKTGAKKAPAKKAPAKKAAG